MIHFWKYLAFFFAVISVDVLISFTCAFSLHDHPSVRSSPRCGIFKTHLPLLQAAAGQEMDSNIFIFRHQHETLNYNAVVLRSEWVHTHLLRNHQKGNNLKRITQIVNDAYEVGEKGMWKGDDVQRTSDGDVLQKLQDEKLVLLLKDFDHQDEGNSNASILNNCYGCIYCDYNFGEGCCELGMFAIDGTFRGVGLGSFLLGAAEIYASQKDCTNLRLELLSPVEYDHNFKKRLDEWYTKMNYRSDYVDQMNNFFKLQFSEIFDKLACSCKFHIYRKEISTDTLSTNAIKATSD